MSVYDRAAATALRMLEKYGQDVTHRAYTAGTYNPATGTAAPTTTDTTRKGALLSYGSGGASMARINTTVRGELVQVSDKRLLLDGSAGVSPQDRIIVAGVEYVPVSIDDISPAGTRVMLDIHARVG